MANELEIIVGAKDKASPVLGGISNEIEGMGKKMTKAGTVMMAAGAGIVGSLVGITMKTAKAGDEVAKMAKRTGLGTVALSELRYAAELSGSSLDDLEKGVKRMQRTIIDAGDGLSTATRALDRLGLSFEGLIGLSPEDQFYMITSAIADVEDPTLRAAVAQEIFGRAGTDLLPMLSGGSEGLKEMREEAHELGVVFDEEAAKEAENFEDAMTRLKESFGKAGKEIGEALMPMLTDLMENKLVPIIQNVSDWISNNEELVRTLLKVGVALIGAGGILVALGTVAKAIIAINAALIVMHSLAGPAGWAKLAIGAAIAAGAAVGLTKLMKDITNIEVPGAQHGAIAKKRSLVEVAENNVPEAIIPLPALEGLGGGTIVNLTVHGSVITERELIDTIYEGLLQSKGRNAILELS